MHRSEIPKSSNTGRIAVAMLDNAVLRVRGLENEVVAEPPPGRRLVLYPMPDARPLSPADRDGEPPVLIVPDGNWSQTRRTLVRDRWARDAEVVRLANMPPTRYRLRRNRPGTACTLEAIAHALAILEGGDVARTMIDVLDRFTARIVKMRTDGGALDRVVLPQSP